MLRVHIFHWRVSSRNISKSFVLLYFLCLSSYFCIVATQNSPAIEVNDIDGTGQIYHSSWSSRNKGEISVDSKSINSELIHPNMIERVLDQHLGDMDQLGLSQHRDTDASLSGIARLQEKNISINFDKNSSIGTRGNNKRGARTGTVRIKRRPRKRTNVSIKDRNTTIGSTVTADAFKNLDYNREEVAKFLKEADELYSNGRLPEALIRFESAIARQLTPDADTLFRRGVVLSELGRLAEALDGGFNPAIQADPTHANALANRGAILVSLNRLTEALENLDAAVANDPNHANALINRGSVLRALGSKEEALSSYNKALKLNPGISHAWYNRAVVLHSLGRAEAALENYDKTISIEPKHINAFYNRGVLLQRELSRSKEALDSLDRARGLLESNEQESNQVNLMAGLWGERAVTLYSLNRFKEALDSCDSAIHAEPADAAALTNKGLILTALNRHTEALESHERAIKLDPKHANAWYNRGTLLENAKRLEEARESYERATKADPRMSKAWANLNDLINRETSTDSRENTTADINKISQKMNDSLGTYEETMVQNPEDPIPYIRQGETLQRLGRMDEALASYESALVLSPQHPRALMRRAVLRSDSGDTDDAVNDFIGALRSQRNVLGENMNLLISAVLWNGRTSKAENTMNLIGTLAPTPLIEQNKKNSKTVSLTTGYFWPGHYQFRMMHGSNLMERKSAASRIRQRLKSSLSDNTVKSAYEMTSQWFKYGSACGELGRQFGSKLRLLDALRDARIAPFGSEYYHLVNWWVGDNSSSKDTPQNESPSAILSEPNRSESWRLAGFGPDAFDFNPPSFILPDELVSFQAYARRWPEAVWMIKNPDADAGEEAVAFVENLDSLVSLFSVDIGSNEDPRARRMSPLDRFMGAKGKTLVMRYIDNPLLVDGRKAEFSVMLVVENADPLRVHLYHRPITAKLSALTYAPASISARSRRRHRAHFLSTYEVVDAVRIVEAVEAPHNRGLVVGWSDGGGGVGAWNELWAQIEAIVAKTTLAAVASARKAQEITNHRMKKVNGGESSMHLSCEHSVFTMDFLVDNNLQPWLLSVNQMPNFTPSPDLSQKKFAADLFSWIADKGERNDEARSVQNTSGILHSNFKQLWPHENNPYDKTLNETNKESSNWWTNVYKERRKKEIDQISEELDQLSKLSEAIADGIQIVKPSDVIDLENILHFSTTI